jgi:hypothetical protein
MGEDRAILGRVDPRDQGRRRHGRPAAPERGQGRRAGSGQGQLDALQPGDRQGDPKVLPVPLDQGAEDLDGRGPERRGVVGPPGPSVPGRVDGDGVEDHRGTSW